MKSFLVDQDGYYGEFGGAYVPEILHKCVEELKNTYLDVIESEDFKKEFDQLLRDYVGRPSPLYLARRLSEKYGCKMYLKREDLNHTGAHKINNTIGQILLARRMGKKRIIAETGAGQHGSSNSHRLCTDEHGVYRLHGQDGCRTPAHQCREDENAGSDSGPGHFGQHDSERCHERSHPRLVLPSLGYVLHHRFYRRPAPISGHGSTSAVGHQRRDKKTASGERRT